MPPCHRIAPIERKIVNSKDEAYTRLQNWAFTNQGLLTLSGSGGSEAKGREGKEW
jgi:hypothetical protein